MLTSLPAIVTVVDRSAVAAFGVTVTVTSAEPVPDVALNVAQPDDACAVHAHDAAVST